MSIFSEKTLHAVKCFRPFIQVAPPGSLELLKQCGVKTFSDYWDESYDREENHEQRLLKIIKVIDYVNSLTIEQLKELYKDMKPILEHNYKAIASLRDQSWIK
jgi:N-glycosylase/DNA lyase